MAAMKNMMSGEKTSKVILALRAARHFRLRRKGVRSYSEINEF